MKLVSQTKQFHVYDDVLPEKDFRAVWNYVQLESYVPVHHDGWVKVWRISDGVPLGAPATVLYESPGRPSAAEDAKGARIYPTHTGLDRVLDVLRNHADKLADVVGKWGVDFENVSARSFLYPQGTGLSWHEDAVNYTGGYAFYAHPEWNVQWGGELLVADESARAQSFEDDRLPVLTNFARFTIETRAIAALGLHRRVRLNLAQQLSPYRKGAATANARPFQGKCHRLRSLAA